LPWTYRRLGSIPNLRYFEKRSTKLESRAARKLVDEE
jgi:hypothetical protein